MIEFILLYTAFVFGINNSGLITGSLIATGFSHKKAIMIAILGFTLGFLIEGSKMQYVLSSISSIDLTLQFIITSIIFTILAFTGLPISMINLLIGSHVGVALASNAIINSHNLFSIVLSWLVTPFIAVFLSIPSYMLLSNMLGRLSLLNINRFYAVSLPILTFYTAYSLAANNIGLLYINNLFFMLLPLAVVAGIVKGRRSELLVSEAIIGHSQASIFSSLLVSSLLLWIFTQLRIPISLSQLLLAGLIGVNIYRKPRVYNKAKLFMLIISWIGSTLVSILLAFLTATFLLDSL